MLFLTEREVKQLLPMQKAIELVRQSFLDMASGKALNLPRRRMYLPSGAVFHQMAGADERYFGEKHYATHPRHGAHFLFTLYRASDAMPLAVMEANELGKIRTGAASGVATDLIASPDASVVGLIGAGFQAKSQLHAICCVRPVREVRVFSRRAESRARFVGEFREYDAGEVRAVTTPELAVEGADIVIAATYSKDPVVADAAIAGGTHINAMGSNAPDRRELSTATVRRAHRIALDSREQAELEAGDLLLAYGGTDWPAAQVCEVAELLSGKATGRTSAKELTIFKSVGLGIQDVAVAGWIYERAVATGIGSRIEATRA
ncbi:MAG: ornithine cyclodeaminase family protein [Bryobacterales bacterium]|nr:ornithine cyclodeaminase family protein [Bryobacterales bacterium]